MSDTRRLWLITDAYAVVEVEATLTPFPPNPKYQGWEFPVPGTNSFGIGTLHRTLFETREEAVKVTRLRIRREQRRLKAALMALDETAEG